MVSTEAPAVGHSLTASFGFSGHQPPLGLCGAKFVSHSSSHRSLHWSLTLCLHSSVLCIRATVWLPQLNCTHKSGCLSHLSQGRKPAPSTLGQWDSWFLKALSQLSCCCEWWCLGVCLLIYDAFQNEWLKELRKNILCLNHASGQQKNL